MVPAERAVMRESGTAGSTPAELLAIAVRIAREAAATARRMRAEAITDVQTKSTDTDVVTAADRAVERQVVEALRRERPGDGVLGEEYGDTAGTAPAGVRWILDPIDGTVNYLYGLPQYAVSLAAEVDGEVVAGVVRNAATDDEWTATRGGGAWRGGRRLTGSVRTTLDQALVATGFGYDAARRAHQGAVLAGLITRVRDIRRFGAAALDLCMAAEGTVDAYFEKGLNPWDYAAGGLVAAEAGLRVSGLDGAPAGPGHAHRRAAGALRRPARRAGGAGRRRRAVSAGRSGALSCPSWPVRGRRPAGSSGSPSSTSDWLTSVVVASCWKLAADHDVDDLALALGVVLRVGLVQEVRPQQVRRADRLGAVPHDGDAVDLLLVLGRASAGLEPPVLELVGDAVGQPGRVGAVEDLDGDLLGVVGQGHVGQHRALGAAAAGDRVALGVADQRRRRRRPPRRRRARRPRRALGRAQSSWSWLPGQVGLPPSGAGRGMPVRLASVRHALRKEGMFPARRR